MLTTMETYRPHASNTYVAFDVEPDVSIEHIQVLRLDRVTLKKIVPINMYMLNMHTCVYIYIYVRIIFPCMRIICILYIYTCMHTYIYMYTYTYVSTSVLFFNKFLWLSHSGCFARVLSRGRQISFVKRS